MRQVVWYLMLAASLSFVGPACGQSAELSATELLQQARNARALWKDFPGFTAKVKIWVDEKVADAELVVDRDGKIQLSNVEPLSIELIQQQLESLVFHRLPGEEVSGKAQFVNEPGQHALGTLIRLENDPMGSAYRVRDSVITQVAREAGPLRFTIDVANVRRTVDGKYLPTVFTVSFRDKESGTLVAEHTFLQKWMRFRGFDLPVELLIISEERDRSRVIRMEFSDLRLLPAPTATGE